MKILVLIKKWSGGVGRYVSEVRHLLEKEGHLIDIISREDDLKVFNLFHSIGKIRALDFKKYDLIYTQDWTLAFPLLFPFRILWKKHFCCFHGHEVGKGKRFQKIVGIIMRKRLVVVGASLKLRFPKALLNYEGINLEVFKPLKKERKYLGWIRREWDWLNEEKVKELSKFLKMPCLIADNVPFDKMNDFYNSCKIFISLPPEYTGFNLCWLEAMAAGVPIIIGNRSGVGENLPIFHVSNFDEILGIIKKNEKVNYAKALKKFTWEGHVSRLIDFFN